MQKVPRSSASVLIIIILRLAYTTAEHCTKDDNKYSRKNNKGIPEEEKGNLGGPYPFGLKESVEENIESLDYMIAPEDFYQHFVLKNKPILFKGVVRKWPAFSWTEEYLISNFGEVEIKVGENHCTESKQSLASLLQDTDAKTMSGSFAMNKTMKNDIIVPLCLRCEEIDRSEFESHLLIGKGNGQSLIHLSMKERLIVPIVGPLKVYLIHPGFSEQLYADFSSCFGTSPIDPESVDFQTFPRAMDLMYFTANLSQGDALYVPQTWWLYINFSNTYRHQRQFSVQFSWDSRRLWQNSNHNASKEAERKVQGSSDGISFAALIQAYNSWVMNISQSTNILQCNEQKVKMSQYYFETDKDPDYVQTIGDGGNIEDEILKENTFVANMKDLKNAVQSKPQPAKQFRIGCHFDLENKESPCHNKNCIEDEESLVCIHQVLDYCRKYEDRGCVIMKPHLLNKRTKEELEMLQNNTAWDG